VGVEARECEEEEDKGNRGQETPALIWTEIALTCLL